MSILILGLAMAAGPATTEQGWKEAAPNAGDKMICERQTEIGSRLKKNRVCKTAAQWREEREATRRLMDDRATHQTNPTG